MPLVPTMAPEVDRSALPPGGSPATDKAFLTWLSRHLTKARTAWLDQHAPDYPPRELVEDREVLDHLFRWLIGLPPTREGWITWNHKVRFVAVQWSLRPDQIEAATDHYLDGKRHEHRVEG